MSGSTVFAQKTWDGGASTTAWGDADNWDPTGVPSSADDVTIDAYTVDINSFFAQAKSVTLNGSTLNLNFLGVLELTPGGGNALSINSATINNDGFIDISNCAIGIRLLGSGSSLNNTGGISVDNHSGNGLLFVSGSTGPSVLNSGNMTFDNSTSTSPTIFYQVSGNLFTNNGILTIGATANAGVGIGFGATASGGMTNNGTIDILNTGAGRAALAVGFLGGSFNNTGTGTLNIGSGVGGAPFGGFNMALTNNGNINVNAPGSVNVVAVGSGTFGGSQPFENSNSFAPGNTTVGCFSFNSGYSNISNSPAPVTNIQLGGTTPCSGYDKILVNGTANLTGTLSVTLTNGYIPVGGESFTILEATTRTGTYTTVNYPTVPGISWTTSYTSTSVIANAQSILPVELTSFSATLEDDQSVHLVWNTASERNNYGFEIESSPDGSYWRTVDFVLGAGNSNESIFYEYFDIPTLGSDYIYYRLRQLDIDGKSTFSEVAAVHLSDDLAASKIAISPNPSNAFFKLNGSVSPESRLIVYDHLGRVVTEAEASNELQYDISNLENGIYSVAIFNQAKTYTYRLLKQQ